MRRYLTLLLLLSAMVLNACGNRGSLYLPPPPKAEPPTIVSPAPTSVTPATTESGNTPSKSSD